MVLGRHRAEILARRVRGPAGSDVAPWGGFVTVSTAVTMAVFGMDAVATAFVTVTLAAGFSLAWWLGLSDRILSTEPVRSAPPPVSPGGPAFPVQPAQEPVIAVDPDSRWIDTFGPPETGQLPIQRYVPDSGSMRTWSAGQTETAFPQWSHSRN